MARGIQAGDKAPDFTLPSQAGEPVRLSDPGGTVRKSYGVPATLGLLPGRVTYVIDRGGTVRHVFNSQVNIGRHIDDALAVVRKLQEEQAPQ